MARSNYSLLNPHQAAEILGVQLEKLWEMQREGKVRHFLLPDGGVGYSIGPLIHIKSEWDKERRFYAAQYDFHGYEGPDLPTKWQQECADALATINHHLEEQSPISFDVREALDCLYDVIHRGGDDPCVDVIRAADEY